MGLKYAVEDLAAVDEADRERYEEQPGSDGKYRLRGIEGLDEYYEPKEAVANLKNAVATERRHRTEAERRLQELRDIDPERYKQLIKDAEDRERQAIEAKGEWGKLQEKMATEHARIVDEKDKRIKAQDEELAQAVIVDGIIRALHSQQSMPGRAEQVLIDAIRPQVTISRENGRVVAMVHDSDGSPAIVIDEGKPRPKTIDDLVRETKEDQTFGRLFQGNPHKGLETTGAGGGQQPSSEHLPLERPLSEWRPREKAEYVQAHGLDAWQQLVVQDQIARRRLRPNTGAG